MSNVLCLSFLSCLSFAHENVTLFSAKTRAVISTLSFGGSCFVFLAMSIQCVRLARSLSHCILNTASLCSWIISSVHSTTWSPTRKAKDNQILPHTNEKEMILQFRYVGITRIQFNEVRTEVSEVCFVVKFSTSVERSISKWFEDEGSSPCRQPAVRYGYLNRYLNSSHLASDHALFKMVYVDIRTLHNDPPSVRTIIWSGSPI